MICHELAYDKLFAVCFLALYCQLIPIVSVAILYCHFLIFFVLLNRYADGHAVGLALPRVPPGAATRQVSRRPCRRHSLDDRFLGCRQT
jgi:hypothetical protein